MKNTSPQVSPYVALRPYLRDGEELLWSGRPSERRKSLPSITILAPALFAIFFSIFWTVMVTASVLTSEDTPFLIYLFPLVGMGFVCFTAYNFLYLVFGSKKTMQQIAYGVTDQRIIILYPVKKGISLKEYLPHNLPEMRLQMEKNGTGSIYFTAPSAKQGNLTAPDPGEAFYHIDDPQKVYNLIATYCDRRETE
ncbi:MAG: hypothetical protein IJW98_07380 [Clostridia bacterium]|nr:hypothetical protein [Clostridia bacterium]